MEIFWFLFRMLTNLFEAIVLCFFICKHFPGKFSKWKNYLINTFAIISITIAYTIYGFFSPQWIIEVSILTLYLFVFACFFKKGFWYEKLFWVVLLISALGIVAVTAVKWTMFITGASQYTIVFGDGIPRIALVVSATFVQVTVIYYFSKFYIHSLNLKKSNYLTLTSIPIFSLILIAGTMEVGMIMEYNVRALFFLVISCIATIAILMIAYYLYFTIASQSKQLLNTQTQLQNKILMEQHNEQLIEMNAQMKTWRHDFHNHLQTLMVVARTHDTKSLEDYIQKLGYEIIAIDNLCNTGDKILDAILSAKLTLAQSYNITFSLNAIPITRLPISDTDKTSLFGNLIDNAIEACKQVNLENRFINLSLEMIQNMISIQMSNSTNGTDNTENGKFVTTKADKQFHGLGIPHINKIVESANGIINREHKNYVFTTTILFEKIDSVIGF